MDCKQMREAMDLYVDGELSAEATAAAGLHLSECAACRGVERKLLLLREGVKAAVTQHRPPEELQLWAHRRFAVPTWRRLLPVSVVVAFVVLIVAGVVQMPAAR